MMFGIIEACPLFNCQLSVDKETVCHSQNMLHTVINSLDFKELFDNRLPVAGCERAFEVNRSHGLKFSSITVMN